MSRQWLYEHADLRSEIERLRDRTQGRAGRVPAAERSTLASLKQRLATLADENRRLRQETNDLKAELALAYGTRRQASHLTAELGSISPPASSIDSPE